MSRIILNLQLFFLMFIIFGFVSFAQSDYELVQKFKKDYANIEQQIKDADSLALLDSIANEIENLKQEYYIHLELLDKALYPDKFESSIAKLDAAYKLRQGDFAAIDFLKVEVSTLKLQVDTLNSKNNELLASLEKLESLSGKNDKQLRRLNNLIADLRTSLQKRDALVMSMVDSLLPPVMREKPMLSSEEKEKITSDVEKDNILTNVKTTIKDNIKYLDLTSLQPEDIAELQQQQVDFSNTWSRIGAKLVEVYSDDKTRARELREIDSLFTLWTASVKQEAWNSIREVFSEKGVPLRNFSDGEEFTNSVNRYIENEKEDIKAIPEEEAVRSFELFVDSTWASEIEPKWTPFLIENGMLAENNKNAIEDNIDVWRSELYPSHWWIWIIFLGVLTAGLAILLSRLRKNSKLQRVAEG